MNRKALLFVIILTIVSLAILLNVIGITFITIGSFIFGWILPFFFYFIIAYNIIFLLLGVLRKYVLRNNREKIKIKEKQIPFFSIIIAVKNEEKVIERLLTRMTELNYPKDKMEVLIIQDGSTDDTRKICENFSSQYNYINLVNRNPANGKPGALNYAMKLAKGEFIATFDADNLPEKNILRHVLSRFDSPNIAAVQGQLRTINISESPVSEIAAYEMRVIQLLASGKNDTNLFTQVYGTNQFFRREALEKVNCWDEKSLTEDEEISVRLVKSGYNIKTSQVTSWQESPNSLKRLFKQRSRWYRGAFEILFKHKNVIKGVKNRSKFLSFDIFLYLLNPLFMILGTINLFLGILFLFLQQPIFLVLENLLFGLLILNIILFSWSIFLALKNKDSRKLLLPIYVYLYWFTITAASFWALIKAIFNKPQKWVKTDRSGKITVDKIK